MQTARYAQPGKQQGGINSRDTEAIRGLRGCLAPHYSKCSPRATTISISWELLRNAESHSRICIFKRPSGCSHAH